MLLKLQVTFKSEHNISLAESERQSTLVVVYLFVLSGFEAVVPTEMLGMFSENEIELMLCGVSTISATDFKCNCLVRRSARFDMVLFFILPKIFSRSLSSRVFALLFSG